MLCLRRVRGCDEYCESGEGGEGCGGQEGGGLDGCGDGMID